MGKVREIYWIERLRQQVKSVIHYCHSCKKYHGKILQKPGTIMLPTFCTTASRAFKNTGVDFEGLFEYKIAKGSLERHTWPCLLVQHHEQFTLI